MSRVCEELYKQAAVDVVQPLPQGEPCCDSSEYTEESLWKKVRMKGAIALQAMTWRSNNLLPIAVLASWPHQEQFT